MSPRTIIVALFPVDDRARGRGSGWRDLLHAAWPVAALLALRLWSYRAIDRAILRAPVIERWFSRLVVALALSLVAVLAVRTAVAWWRGAIGS